MSENEKRELKRALVATALYYGETIPDEALRLYAADLEDLPLPAVLEALHRYRRDRRSRRRPLPADIRVLIEGECTAESRGRDIAARLHGALMRYGRDWPAGYIARGERYFSGGGREWHGWREAARAELGGEDALDVLTRLGGWQGYYQYANYAEPTVVAAQIRDLAVATVRLRAQRPALPPAEATRALPEASQPATASDLVSGLAEQLSTVPASDERGSPK